MISEVLQKELSQRDRTKPSPPPKPEQSDQLELFKEIDPRKHFYILPRYKVAVPRNQASLSTLDLFLAEQGDYSTSIGDIKSTLETEENITSRGFKILVLLENYHSEYEDWYRKVYPIREAKKKVYPIVEDL